MPSLACFREALRGSQDTLMTCPSSPQDSLNCSEWQFINKAYLRIHSENNLIYFIPLKKITCQVKKRKGTFSEVESLFIGDRRCRAGRGTRGWGSHCLGASVWEAPGNGGRLEERAACPCGSSRTLVVLWLGSHPYRRALRKKGRYIPSPLPHTCTS